MWRQHPAPIEHIPVSLGIYTQLRLASAFTNDEKEVWEIVEEAVDQWMRLHGPGTIPGPATGGVQWKRLFLPNGTLLRTVFDGKNYHCVVEADALNYDGKAVSPSSFVNAVGGIRRNAWKCLWLLFPDSKEWKLADSLRTLERPRRARRFPPTPRHQPAPQPATYAAPVTPAIAPAACGAPVIDAGPVQAEAPALAALRARPARDALHDREALAGPAGDLRPRQRADRRAHGEDPLAALFRQHLLPLLQRLCTGQADPPGAFGTA